MTIDHESGRSQGRDGDAPPERLRLPAFVRLGAPITLTDAPEGTTRVVATNARGDAVIAMMAGQTWNAHLTTGTWQVDALDASGAVLGEELVTVGRHPSERPVHAFVTSYEHDATAATVDWLTNLRATAVQFYDWMASYCTPVGSGDRWHDPSHRPVERVAVQHLAACVRNTGGIALAYAPVYAADVGYAVEHPEQMLYRSDGGMERLFDAIKLANPANGAWQEQFVGAYGAAGDVLGFNGYHVDTYGFPRAAVDAEGTPVDMFAAYEMFLGVLREHRPHDTVSFNQVNGFPSSISLPAEPAIRYCETWPPNDSWRHFEGLLDRASGRAGRLAGRSGREPEPAVRGSLACYPPVWGRPGEPIAASERPNALHTVVCTEAITTMLGASLLVYGDQRAVLSDAYYPQHERLTTTEGATVLEWHRFALRCRDLFLEGEDTSWYEIRDENGAVSVHWDGLVSPEPASGTVFARVVSSDAYLAVGVLDLTGSVSGRWSTSTRPGSCRGVVVQVLRAQPERWEAATAVLGLRNHRFETVPATLTEHREGHALEVTLPIVAGWSVLRLTPRRG